MDKNWSSKGQVVKTKYNGYLYKGSLYSYTEEPIAEAICSDILDYIGLNHIKYELVTPPEKLINKFKNKYVSKCKINEGIIQFGKIIDINSDGYEFFEMIDNIDILNMFLFDALVSNPDRHFNNIHILDDKLIILDNGQSLQSMNSFIPQLNTLSSEPYTSFHDDQISLLLNHTNIHLSQTFIKDIDIKIIEEIILKYTRYIKETKASNLCELIRKNYKMILSIEDNTTNTLNISIQKPLW